MGAAATTPHADLIRQLSADAEHRGSLAARRSDGAFFTADDVAQWLARRALSELLDSAGTTMSAQGRAARRARLASIRVLDPTCGAGAFLLAAWGELRSAEAELDALDGDAREPRVAATQLHGVDVDAGAADTCRDVLELVAGPGADIRRADALEGFTENYDLLLGNPPYVRAALADAPTGLQSASAVNLAAWIVERALAACAPGGRIAMVLPVSAASSPKWGGLRQAWAERCSQIRAAHFDTIPATLFPGVVQRITLLEGAVRTDAEQGVPTQWHTTRYHRWLRSERAGLLEQVKHVAIDVTDTARPLPKLGSELERDLWDSLHAHPPIGRWFDPAEADNVVHYKRRWSYFLLFADFVPPIWDADGNERLPSELQTIGIDPRIDARAVVAVFSSTLLWWWFSALTDNRNVNRGDIATFPVPELTPEQIERLAALGAELMVALRACAEVRTCTYRSVGTIRNTYFRQAETRPVLDRIDTELAAIYGMTHTQLTAVLDYERRFRS